MTLNADTRRIVMTTKTTGAWLVLGALMACATGACEDNDNSSSGASTAGAGGTGAAPGTGGAGGTGGGGTTAGNWACIGDVEAPMFAAGDAVDLSMNVHDAADEPIADATVRLCAYTDAACGAAVSEGATKSTGQVILQEPPDARHFLACSAAGYVDSLVMMNGPSMPNACPNPDETACTCQGCAMTECNDGDASFTDCTCPQCATDPYCSNVDNCHDNDECNPWLEGCGCADCADHPNCGGSAGPGFVCDVSKAVHTPALMHTQAELDLAFAQSGIAEDPTRGHVGIGIADCVGTLAAGVRITADTADGQTIVGYDDAAGVPSMELTETSTYGVAILANLPPGEVTITGTVAATGEVIATRTALVRAGTVTVAAPLTPVPQAP